MNLAIATTVSRILLTPIILVLFFSNTEFCHELALLLFVTAVISDGLDGYWARQKNQVTIIGANLDALADKILMTAMLFSLLHRGLLSAPLVFAMFFREMIVDGMRNYLKDIPKRFGTNLWGKTKFMGQTLSVCLGMLAHIFSRRIWLSDLANVCLGVTLLVSLPGLIMVVAAAGRAMQIEKVLLPIPIRSGLALAARSFSKLATSIKSATINSATRPREMMARLKRRASTTSAVAEPAPGSASEPR